MKRIVVLLMCIILIKPVFAQDDVISKYFERYEGRDDFTIIYITSRMFELIAQIPESENEEDVMNVIRKLKGLKIITTDEYPDKNSLYKEALGLLPKQGFDELMIVKEGDEEIKFMINEKGGKIHEFVMLIGGDDTFFLMSMIGDLTLEDISKLSETMEIDGFENLDKLKDKQ
jgi:hypothetical protein